MNFSHRESYFHQSVWLHVRTHLKLLKCPGWTDLPVSVMIDSCLSLLSWVLLVIMWSRTVVEQAWSLYGTVQLLCSTQLMISNTSRRKETQMSTAVNGEASRWLWSSLKECRVCRAASKHKVATLKNLKYWTCWFIEHIFVYYIFRYTLRSFIVVWSSSWNEVVCENA